MQTVTLALKTYVYKTCRLSTQIICITLHGKIIHVNNTLQKATNMHTKCVHQIVCVKAQLQRKALTDTPDITKQKNKLKTVLIFSTENDSKQYNALRHLASKYSRNLTFHLCVRRRMICRDMIRLPSKITADARTACWYMLYAAMTGIHHSKCWLDCQCSFADKPDMGKPANLLSCNATWWLTNCTALTVIYIDHAVHAAPFETYSHGNNG